MAKAKKAKAPPCGLTTLLVVGEVPRELDVIEIARDVAFRSSFMQIGHLDLEQWLMIPPEQGRDVEGIIYTSHSRYGSQWADERRHATESLLDSLDQMHTAAKQRAVAIIRVPDLVDAKHAPTNVRRQVIVLEQSPLARQVAVGTRKAKTATAAHEKALASLKRAKLVTLGVHAVDTQADAQRVGQIIRSWIVEQTRVAE